MWPPQESGVEVAIVDTIGPGDDTAATITMILVIGVVLFATWLRYEPDPDWRIRRNTAATRQAARRLRTK